MTGWRKPRTGWQQYPEVDGKALPKAVFKPGTKGRAGMLNRRPVPL